MGSCIYGNVGYGLIITEWLDKNGLIEKIFDEDKDHFDSLSYLPVELKKTLKKIMSNSIRHGVMAASNFISNVVDGEVVVRMRLHITNMVQLLAVVICLPKQKLK